jgi:hypothetical protein
MTTKNNKPKVDLRGASVGKMQIGDHNRMEHFQNFVDTAAIRHPEDKKLKDKITELQKAVEQSQFEPHEKEAIAKDLKAIIQELQRPSTEQDKFKITSYWEKVIAKVKEVSSLAALAKIVAELIKLVL